MQERGAALKRSVIVTMASCDSGMQVAEWVTASGTIAQIKEEGIFRVCERTIIYESDDEGLQNKT